MQLCLCKDKDKHVCNTEKGVMDDQITEEPIHTPPSAKQPDLLIPEKI